MDQLLSLDEEIDQWQLLDWSLVTSDTLYNLSSILGMNVLDFYLLCQTRTNFRKLTRKLYYFDSLIICFFRNWDYPIFKFKSVISIHCHPPPHELNGQSLFCINSHICICTLAFFKDKTVNQFLSCYYDGKLSTMHIFRHNSCDT